MRVLLAHSVYDRSQPSGENAFVADLAVSLRARGCEVSNLELEVADWSATRKVLTWINVVSGSSGLAEVMSEVRRFQPDVVHFNNVFPLISPVLFRKLEKLGVPTVMTLHNYRLGCLNGLCFRSGEICQRCVTRRFAIPGIAFGCYRGSRIGSVAMAIHRWRLLRNLNHVSRLLPVTELVGRKAVEAGASPTRVRVTRNFPESRSTVSCGPPESIGKPLRVLFAGRLTVEKGIRFLLDSTTKADTIDLEVVIVGSGPLESEVSARAAVDRRISFLGKVASTEVGQLISASDLVVIPSLWFEADPLIIHEALSRGVAPVVFEHSAAAASLGSTPELVAPATPEGLMNLFQTFAENRELLREVTRRAVQSYDEAFDPVTDQILRHYESVTSGE